jgi:hypothetical protein
MESLIDGPRSLSVASPGASIQWRVDTMMRRYNGATGDYLDALRWGFTLK